MKKTLIILILTIGLLWLLILPLAVGGYLRQWVPAWLEEVGLEDSARFAPGWFASGLALEDVADLELTARHFPPLGLDWIRFDGRLNSSISSTAFRLRGEVGLSGASRFELSGDSLALSEPLQVQAESTELTLQQRLSEPSALVLRMGSLHLTDRLGNRLNSATAVLDLGWTTIDEDTLALSMAIASTGPEPIELSLSAQPVQREALADLIDGLQQLSQSEPRTTAQQLALLTVAGAWQQLSQHGLRVQLDSLMIGGENQFQGDWITDEGQPVITGTGSVTTLKSSLRPIVGLSARLAPAEAGRIIDAWLEQLAQRGWLDIAEDRFEFRYDGSSPET